MGNQTEVLTSPDLDPINFAAFVMTYQRPLVIIKTLEKILSQTFSPALILVVDNSDDQETQTVIQDLAHPIIEYQKMDYNIGPAGAAFFGLKVLAGKGFQWIYWGDDDNPPRDELVFEKMFKKIYYLQNEGFRIGLLAGKGGRINKLTGRINSLSNEELMQGTVVEVDCVPGGHDLLVNSEVVKKGVFPKKELFFGFEELDFSLQVRNKNFRIFIDAETWLQVRRESKNVAKKFRHRSSSFGNSEDLGRLYYSTRNLLFIYFHHGWYIAFSFIFLKAIVRSVAGFGFGFSYGIRNFHIVWKAIVHFFCGRFGKFV